MDKLVLVANGNKQSIIQVIEKLLKDGQLYCCTVKEEIKNDKNEHDRELCGQPPP